MNELITMRTRTDFRWQLLATASALTLVSVCVAPIVRAQDEGRPTIWIELGGQLESVSGKDQPFIPSFSATAIEHGLPPPASVQKGSRYDFGGEGAIAFAPENSDWVFSAAVRYGRSNATKRNHQQTRAPKTPNPFCVPGSPYCIQPYLTLPRTYITADNRSSYRRNTTIVDFQAGRDVGLGIFAKNGSSFNFGIRFAQFTSSSALDAYGIPYPHWGEPKYLPTFHINLPAPKVHQYHATASAARSFTGVGPSLTWKSSAHLAGSEADGTRLTLDWGINGALLFGRQKASGHFRTKDIYYNGFAGVGTTYNTGNIGRAHSVIVPNVGGTAAFTLNFPNAKVSLGYRADFFFGATDGGIDTRASETVGFHGPFATISVGLGG